MAGAFYDVDRATYVLYGHLNDGQLTVWSGAWETGDIFEWYNPVPPACVHPKVKWF